MNTVTNVKKWLEGLGLNQYAQAFAQNDIDVEALPRLTTEDLKEIGVQSVGHRRKLLDAIAALGRDERETPPQQTARAEPGPAGERRQVTILFADLSDFTKLSNELGAEETHALLNRYFEFVDGIVEGYGGHVDKHIGDSVMAVFGAPVAHSNDPERAVRAALDIHTAMEDMTEALARPLQAHIGVASGQVVASGTGSETHQEYTVTGNSVNLASRLQDQAGAGETLISNAVYGAVSTLVDCVLKGEVGVKGFPEPVPVWRLVKLRGDGTAARHSTFVGRRSEKRQFTAVIEECLETGTGLVILVRGEAGIGKTRLVEEFTAIAVSKGFAAHKGLVLDFGVDKGRVPLGTLVRSLLGLVVGGDGSEQLVEANWLQGDERVFLNDLLDLPQPLDLHSLYDAMDNETRQKGKQRVVAKLVESRSAEQPILLMVEDTHWADPFTLACLAEIASVGADRPVMLVLTSRIEGDPLDRAWRATLRGSSLVTIDLRPLREAEARELSSDFVETPSAVVEACIARAEGNPFFLEQLLRNADQGAMIEVPGTIRSLMMARMDRLEARDKQALQAASVIGQRFSLEALRHLLGDATYESRALVEQYLVRPEGSGFLFAHALIQECVYSSLLRARKRELHRSASDLFAEHDPVLYAEHLDWAEDPEAPAAYLKAAEAQAAAFRYARALRLAERGCFLANAVVDRFHLGLLKAQLLRELGRVKEAIDAFRSLLELATDEINICRAWIGVASCVRLLGGYEEGIEALEAAELLARRHAAYRELSQITYYRGCLLYAAGDSDSCLDQHKRAHHAAIQAGDPECEARAESGLGDAYYGQGRMSLAIKHYGRCRTICDQHAFGRIEVGSAHMIGVCRRYVNEFHQAIGDSRAVISKASKVGNARTEMVALMNLGELLVNHGDLEGAYAALERSLAIVDNFGNRRFRAYILCGLGRALWHDSRRRKEAEPVLADALELSRDTEIAFVGPRILAAKALATSCQPERHAALEEGEAILRSGCSAHNGLWFYRDAIEAALNARDWDGAERYAAALETFTKPEPLPWSKFFIGRGRALAAFGRGNRDRATIQQLHELRDEAERVGLRVTLPALEEALEAVSNPVRKAPTNSTSG